ncbi:MAG TPA: zinc ribbon domain-containing protein, partial [Steroidobacteraceae bacterium]|nr:zinc ribbon domain-containing protein [Steroidobacteraceae bacterium]
YEYECSACRHHLEAMQKVSDAPLRKCPNCGRQKLVRLISAPVFRLKGAGWYETDFKSEAERKRNLAEHPEKDADKKTEEPAKTEEKSKEPAQKVAAEKPASEAKPKSKTAKVAPVKAAKKKAAPRKAAAAPKRRAAAR